MLCHSMLVSDVYAVTASKVGCKVHAVLHQQLQTSPRLEEEDLEPKLLPPPRSFEDTPVYLDSFCLACTATGLSCTATCFESVHITSCQSLCMHNKRAGPFMQNCLTCRHHRPEDSICVQHQWQLAQLLVQQTPVFNSVPMHRIMLKILMYHVDYTHTRLVCNKRLP